MTFGTLRSRLTCLKKEFKPPIYVPGGYYIDNGTFGLVSSLPIYMPSQSRLPYVNNRVAYKFGLPFLSLANHFPGLNRRLFCIGHIWANISSWASITFFKIKLNFQVSQIIFGLKNCWRQLFHGRHYNHVISVSYWCHLLWAGLSYANASWTLLSRPSYQIRTLSSDQYARRCPANIAACKMLQMPSTHLT